MKIGRPKRSFDLTNGEQVTGLCPLGNGRWRITRDGPHKGKRFNEKDERLAVAKFRKIVGDAPTVTIPVSSVSEDELTSDAPSAGREAFAASIDSEIDATGNVTFIQKVDQAKIWAWCREQIISDSVNAAKQLGLPAIANLDHSSIPGKAIRLIDIIDVYLKKSESKQNTRGHVASAMKKLASLTGASTLPDLTTPALMAFREKIITQLAPTGAVAIFGKVSLPRLHRWTRGCSAGPPYPHRT